MDPAQETNIQTQGQWPILPQPINHKLHASFFKVSIPQRRRCSVQLFGKADHINLVLMVGELWRSGKCIENWQTRTFQFCRCQKTSGSSYSYFDLRIQNSNSVGRIRKLFPHRSPVHDWWNVEGSLLQNAFRMVLLGIQVGIRG